MEFYNVRTIDGTNVKISREQAERVFEIIEHEKHIEEVKRAIIDMKHEKEIPIDSVSETAINDICAEFESIMSDDTSRQFALDDTVYEYFYSLFFEDIKEVLDDLEMDISMTDSDKTELFDRYINALKKYDRENDNDKQRIFVVNDVVDEYLFEKGIEKHE